MKLSEYAKKNNVTYITAHNWYKKGLIPNAYQLPSGTIIVKEEQKKLQKNVIYCRVSSKDRKHDLDLQVERCKQYCLSKGIKIDEIYKQIDSGMNDNRKEFWKMIESNPTTIICQNKDRLNEVDSIAAAIQIGKRKDKDLQGFGNTKVEIGKLSNRWKKEIISNFKQVPTWKDISEYLKKKYKMSYRYFFSDKNKNIRVSYRLNSDKSYIKSYMFI